MPKKIKLPSPCELQRAARERFLKACKAEAVYQRQLVGVAKQVGLLVRGFAPDGTVTDSSALRSALMRYAEVLRPWARAFTANMHASVARRDLGIWTELEKEMGIALREEIVSAPTGQAMRMAMALETDRIVDGIAWTELRWEHHDRPSPSRLR